MKTLLRLRLLVVVIALAAAGPFAISKQMASIGDCSLQSQPTDAAGSNGCVGGAAGVTGCQASCFASIAILADAGASSKSVANRWAATLTARLGNLIKSPEPAPPKNIAIG